MRRSNALLISLLAWGLVLALMPGAWALAADPLGEVEPNDSCVSAQALGAVGAGLTLAGTLEVDPNLDFFRVTAPPGAFLELTLRGAASASGTLPDPYLGVFSADCSGVIAISDDSQGSLDSLLRLTAPDDGELVIAATSCCDPEFTSGGGSSGTYTLAVVELTPIGSIGGQVVDAATGGPPDPTGGPVAVRLFECFDEACEGNSEVAFLTADEQGRFAFGGTVGVPPLVAGRYLLIVGANLYEQFIGAPFIAGPGEEVDLGTIALTPIPLIGSAGARLVDGVTGKPLRGDAAPFAFAHLLRLNDEGFFEFVAAALPAPDGGVSFSPGLQQTPMRPGTYIIIGFAEQYTQAESAPFSLGEGESLDIGDLALQPNPVRVINPVMCEGIPPWGGTCRYSVTLVNSQSRSISLKAWSVINISQPQGSLSFSTFQAQTARTHRIARGRQQRAPFQIWIPRDVPVGTVICPVIFVADNESGFYFKPDLVFGLPCTVKEAGGGFRTVTAEEGRAMQQAALGAPAAVRSRR